MKHLSDLLQLQLSTATNLSLLVFTRVSRISCSWCLEKQGGRKEGQKIWWLHPSNSTYFSMSSPGWYGQNSLNISIILYTNAVNHSWNMEWWYKQIVMVNYIVAMMIVAWFSIKCLHIWCRVVHTKPLKSISVFLRIFCLYPKWQSSIGRCRKSGNHP
jgi:hypothetical protein